MSDFSSPGLQPGADAAGDASSTSSDELTILALLAEVVVLVLALIVGQVLHKSKCQWLGEAGSALLLGLLVGLIIWLAGATTSFTTRITFKKEIFLYIMLPTIIFDAGFNLDPKLFVRNVGSVSLYAFAGTTISTFVVGLMMWGFGIAGACQQLSLLYNLLFGALISATDPVTVLAVFSKLGANDDLYMNVFGESCLNDAVALVLFETLKTFLGKAVTVGSVFAGIGKFVGIFLGSVAFGLFVGFLAALLFRTSFFRDEDAIVEAGIVVCFAFISYLGAQAAYMSGIVAVLFSGMFMKTYVAPNLTTITRLRVETLFKTMAGLFELFVFIYIGLTLFLAEEQFDIWKYTLLCLVALAVSRFVNIVPCSWVINWLRLPDHRVDGKNQFMLWWSGLRGAMAFALAIDAADSFGEAGQIMKTCTFYIVLITVLINGGACGYLLEKLDLLKVSKLPQQDTELAKTGTCNGHGRQIGHKSEPLPDTEGVMISGLEGPLDLIQRISMKRMSVKYDTVSPEEPNASVVLQVEQARPETAIATAGQTTSCFANASPDGSGPSGTPSSSDPLAGAAPAPPPVAVSVSNLDRKTITTKSLGRTSTLQRVRYFNSHGMDKRLDRWSQALDKLLLSKNMSSSEETGPSSTRDTTPGP